MNTPARAGLLLAAAVFLAAATARLPQERKHQPRPDTLYTYRGDILPLLKANCTPCHFPGGKVYDKHPFDDSTTVARLGRRLNTRLKKKEQQRIISGWVDQLAR